MIRRGIGVDLFSTNGTSHFPEDLRANLRGSMEEGTTLSEQEFDKKLLDVGIGKAYDLAISYTAPKNFRPYLSRSTGRRFGIWCYEWERFPEGFARGHVYASLILAPSEFAKKLWIDNGVPKEKVIVLPHGINLDDFAVPAMDLGSKKKKILVNIGQPHLRKNIKGMLDAYGKAFSKNDNVILIAKIAKKEFSKLSQFEVHVPSLFEDFYKTYPQHAQVKLISEFLPNMAGLYNACDIVFTMSYSEGFYLPGLEALAAGKINVCPRYGGQLDFLNDDNAVLLDGKMIRADVKMQYWSGHPQNSCFSADAASAAVKLRETVENYEKMHAKFLPKMQEKLPEYSWSRVVDQILDKCK